ncbi:MAG: hypothetical protein KAJ98_02840 [Spirochaetaceae bacterium]|nr:hypothetical protein [Spirochaetaceae bacterium]
MQFDVRMKMSWKVTSGEPVKNFAAVFLACLLLTFSSCVASPPIAEPEAVTGTKIAVGTSERVVSRTAPKPVPVPESEFEPDPFIRIDHEVRNLSATKQGSIPELVTALDAHDIPIRLSGYPRRLPDCQQAEVRKSLSYCYHDN